MRQQLERAVESGVEAMAAAVDMRDDYTGAHSEEVVRLARRVGERMGLRDNALSELEFAARLHDVGKIGVPDAVLRKDGPLDHAEWEVMCRHPEWGAQMLAACPVSRASRESCGTRTSGGTARATPTGCARRTSPSKAGSSSRATPIRQ